MADPAIIDNDPYGLVAAQQSSQTSAPQQDNDPYGLLASQNTEPPVSSPRPPLTTQAPSKTDGFLMGLRAPLDAGAQMVAHALPDNINSGLDAVGKTLGLSSSDPTQMDADIAQRDNAYKTQRSAAGETGIDWPYVAGNTVANAPIATLAPELKGLPFLAKAANVLAQGYAYGSLSPVDNTSNNFWGQKNSQGEMGALVNGVMAPVTSLASKFISPAISDNVKTLLNNDITPTIGQTLGGAWKATEDKLTSIPFLGDMIKNAQNRTANDLNVAVGNKALAPIGETVSSNAGRDMVEEVSQKLGNAYDTLLPKLTFKPDQQFGSEINKINQMATFLPPPQAAQFNNILNNKLFSRLSDTGMMDGQTLKGVESELSGVAKGYMSDPSFDNRQLGSAISEVLSSVRGNLQRTNPAFADQLSNINKGYANYTILRKAASNLGQSTEPGVFSPSQLQSAVKAADQTVGKGNFAKGNARMQDLSDSALQVMGGKYPDSGSVGRAAIPLMGAAALGHVNPMAAFGALATAAPYTKVGQNIASAMLTKRPDFAAPLAQAVRKGSPYLAGGLVPQFGRLVSSNFAPFSFNGAAQ